MIAKWPAGTWNYCCKFKELWWSSGCFRTLWIQSSCNNSRQYFMYCPVLRRDLVDCTDVLFFLLKCPSFRTSCQFMNRHKEEHNSATTVAPTYARANIIGGRPVSDRADPTLRTSDSLSMFWQCPLGVLELERIFWLLEQCTESDQFEYLHSEKPCWYEDSKQDWFLVGGGGL